MKKQNGNSNNLLRKNNTISKEASQGKVETPSLLKELGLIIPKRKRTRVKRRRLDEIFASLDRQAPINDQCVVLPSKTDEKELKRRRGRPSKSARKQSMIKKTSILTRKERVDDHGVEQNKQISPDKSGLRKVKARPQLEPLLSLLPQPPEAESWRPKFPPEATTSLQSLQPLPEGGPSDSFRLEKCAESLYGKEFFLKREPPVIGLHTAMMLIAHNPHCNNDAVKAYHHQISSAFTASVHDELDLSLGSGGQSPTPNPNLLFSWAPSNENLFVRPDIYMRVQDQQAEAMLTQQHQLPP